jgi:hypothetical protein
MVRNALTEQEAYGLESLVTCMQTLLPHDLPFYEERKFGDADDEDHGLYSGDGGNFCTYVQGMILHALCLYWYFALTCICSLTPLYCHS